MEKKCGRCAQSKNVSEFYLRKGVPAAWCKACYREWHRERYVPRDGVTDAPRDCLWCGTSYQPKQRRASKYCSPACGEAARKASGHTREKHLIRTFGITQADYDRMLADQGGGCALCGKTAEEQKGRYQTYLHVDHCHDTGRVRGLLCDEHNLLLGRFNDDPALLRRAAAYLEADAS